MGAEHPWLQDYSHAQPWGTRFPAKAVDALVDESAARFGNRPFYDFMGRVTTYQEAAALIARAAKGFQQLGVGPGVKVGLFLPNCPQYVIAYYGILKAGGTVVNFSPLYSIPELVQQVEDSHTDIMVSLDVAALFPTIDAVLRQSRLRCLIIGSIAEALPRGKALLYRLFKRRERARVAVDSQHLRFDQLLDNDGAFSPVARDPERDVAVLQYTGGTTGTPKGAMLTHANLSINAQQVAGLGRQMRPGEERMMGALPFFHVFANTVVLNATAAMGGEILMLPKFELLPALKLVQRRKATIFPGVPTMYVKMLEHPQFRKFDLTSLKVCISGGAPLPVELKKQFEAASGAIVCEGYGLTETSGVVAVNPFEGLNKSGSIGLPVPGTAIIITDRDNPRHILPQGEVGELCITGPQVMVGYWQRPDASAEVLVDGRLRTGDVGYQDADGYTFIIDRMKDMIAVGGFKVFPRRVEEALYEHPSVKEATVIGIPDASLGERPKAFVVLKDEARATTAGDLMAFLKPKLGKHELPVAIELRAELPKTMIGKLSKKELVAEEKARFAAACAEKAA